MGIAAYNRGSACISRGILMDAGRWREPAKPTPRPATWGSKTKARALDRARNILATNRRLVAELGPDVWKPITLEILAGATQERERLTDTVALEAARLALEEVEAPKMRIAAPEEERLRVALPPGDEELMELEDATTATPRTLRRGA